MARDKAQLQQQQQQPLTRALLEQHAHDQQQLLIVQQQEQQLLSPRSGFASPLTPSQKASSDCSDEDDNDGSSSSMNPCDCTCHVAPKVVLPFQAETIEEERFVREVLEQPPLKQYPPPASYLQRLLKCLYTAAELLQLPLTDSFCDAVFALMRRDEEMRCAYLSFQVLDRPGEMFVTCKVHPGRNELGLRSWTAGLFLGEYLATGTDLSGKTVAAAGFFCQPAVPWISQLLHYVEHQQQTQQSARQLDLQKKQELQGSLEPAHELTVTTVQRLEDFQYYAATDRLPSIVANCSTNLRLNGVYVDPESREAVSAAAAAQAAADADDESQQAGEATPRSTSSHSSSRKTRAATCVVGCLDLEEVAPGVAHLTEQVVLAADLLYDTKLNETLANALQFLLGCEDQQQQGQPDQQDQKRRRLCVMASTVRDPATREHFLDLLTNRGLACYPVRLFYGSRPFRCCELRFGWLYVVLSLHLLLLTLSPMAQ
ncbi:hypothetical protein cyc_04528 [Cyclospora cayetanensis]|uniref:Uncharacterized protein n=1 Tax=Cyclospora cayetanensis TaxID=88456 RepID=A0A1D3CXL3_9EIME|nr:hypothetical protein cyc_04528 [Cyclospora cayetanensis]